MPLTEKYSDEALRLEVPKTTGFLHSTFGNECDTSTIHTYLIPIYEYGYTNTYRHSLPSLTSPQILDRRAQTVQSCHSRRQGETQLLPSAQTPLPTAQADDIEHETAVAAVDLH